MKLLLAGFNTRAFAETAVLAGFDTDSIDCFGDCDHSMWCRVHTVRENALGLKTMNAVTDKVLYLLNSQDYDYFAYTSGYENLPEYLAKIEDTGVRLLGNPSDTVAKVRNILSLNKILLEEGFFAPLSLPSGKSEGNKRRWLKKPLGGGGGRGVEFTDYPESLPRDFFVQEYITGTPSSFVFLATGGRCRLLGVSEQLIGIGDHSDRQFGYAGNIFPIGLPDGKAVKVLAYLQSMAEWFSTTFNLVGLNGIDFIYDGDRCWFIEINPRYTASMELVEMAGGTSMAKLHFDACRGVLPPDESLMDPLGWTPSGDRVFYGKKIVYTGKDIQVIYPEIIDNHWIRKIYNLGIRDLPHHGEIIRRGKPVATVLAKGKSRDECMENLEELTVTVRGFTKTLGF